jgi:phage head maturation protease
MSKIVRREMSMVLGGQLAAGASDASNSRTRRFVASTEAVDSYNTIIRADGWDLSRFEKNPVILFGHNGRQLPIGKGRAAVEGKQLMLDVEFFDAETNPVSEQALRILDAGVMGVSVGFDAVEFEYDASRETGDEWQDLYNPPLNFTKTMLLEVSVVTIPANPEALPVGRELAQRRMQERLAPKFAPPAPPAPVVEPVAVQRAPEPSASSLEELQALVERVVRSHLETKKAADLRRRGKTS